MLSNVNLVHMFMYTIYLLLAWYTCSCIRYIFRLFFLGTCVPALQFIDAHHVYVVLCENKERSMHTFFFVVACMCCTNPADWKHTQQPCSTIPATSNVVQVLDEGIFVLLLANMMVSDFEVRAISVSVRRLNGTYIIALLSSSKL